MKYNVLFYPQKVTDNIARLRMRVSWSGERVAINVGYNIDRDKWNADTNRCKRNSFHGKNKVSAATINADIQRYDNAVHDVMEHFRTAPTKEEFKRAFHAIVHPDKPQHTQSLSIWNDWSEYIAECERLRNWEANTSKIARFTARSLQAWNPALTYNGLDEAGLISYNQYLVDTNHHNNVIMRYLSNVKSFLRWALSKHLTTAPLATSYRPRLKNLQRTVVYLTWDELMTIYNAPLRSPSQRIVRDIFCFCCFTGLRYSDVMRLKKANITTQAIDITTQKTHATLHIELNKYSHDIYMRYRDAEGDNLFPRKSLDKFNVSLKLIGRTCNIDEQISISYYVGSRRHDEVLPKYKLLSSHCGRRTFVCNALMLGIAPNIVMKWTGHTDYKSMRPYIDIADSVKAEAMSLFDKK